MKRFINGYRSAWLMMLVVICMLILPPLYRAFSADGYPLRSDSYNSLAGQPGAYKLLLGGASFLIGEKTSWFLIPLLLGFGSAVLFYLLLKNLGILSKERFVISLLFVTTPVFFSTFSSLVSSQFALFLVILGYYFLNKMKKIFFFLSLLIFLSLPAFGYVFFFMSVLPLFFLKKRQALAILVPSLISAFLMYSAFIIRFGLPVFGLDFHGGLLGYFISDLGGQAGFGVFFVLLAIIGIFVSWKEKRKNALLYVFTVLLLASALIDRRVLVLAMAVLSYFAGSGFLALFQRKWKLPHIRNFSLLLMVCGLLFSITSFISLEFSVGPSIAEIESLKWLKGMSVGGDVVLSIPQNGGLIKSISGLDPVAFSGVGVNEDFQAVNATFEVFRSRNLARTRGILNDFGVRFIWLDKKTLDEVWGTEEDGLLFLFRNNETFKRIYNHTSIQIWEVIR